METKDYLTNYYERYDENGRLISKHGMVEYLTTMKYVEKYLKPNMRVLEIGAATGRYSHALAQKGYRVDAVELVEHNIKKWRPRGGQRLVSEDNVLLTRHSPEIKDSVAHSAEGGIDAHVGKVGYLLKTQIFIETHYQHLTLLLG